MTHDTGAPRGFDDGGEERLRMTLQSDIPGPMDAQSIMRGARRRRTRQRMQVGGALAAVAVVAAGVPLALTTWSEGPSTNASAPQRESGAAPADQRASRAGAPAPVPSAAARTGIALPDGLRVEEQAAGFCVVGASTAVRTCRATEGALVAQGESRRWVVFHGTHRSDSVQYAGSGGWLRMEPRSEFHGAPTMVAYAPDPVGDGPFRVRQLTPDNKVIWEG